MLAMFFPLAATAASLELEPSILRSKLAERLGQVVHFRPEGFEPRVISFPSAAWDIPESFADDLGFLEVQLEQAASLQGQIIYHEETPYALPPRHVAELLAAPLGVAPLLTKEPPAAMAVDFHGAPVGIVDSRSGIIFFEVPRADRASSFTLAARHGPASVRSVRLHGPDDLSLSQRLHAQRIAPLQIHRLPETTGGDGFIQETIQFAMREQYLRQVIQLPLRLRVESMDSVTVSRFSADINVEISLNMEAGRDGYLRFPLPSPLTEQRVRYDQVAQHALRYELLAGHDVIASTTTPAYAQREGMASIPPWVLDAKGSYALPYHSIEDFHAYVRNGELVLYASVSPEGRGPAEMVWVAVGDGERWFVEEPLLRTRRDVGWLAGGPLALAAAQTSRGLHGYFSSAHADGRESLCSAFAPASFRLQPAAQNPHWTPEAPVLEAPLIRGNVLFAYNDSLLSIHLLRAPNSGPAVRVLASNFPSRFSDLGLMPLPGLSADASWMTGYAEGERFYLLTGPSPQMFMSDHPLRGWKEVPAPALGAGKQQLLKWQDRIWVFALARHLGQGIIAWWPYEGALPGSPLP